MWWHGGRARGRGAAAAAAKRWWPKGLKTSSHVHMPMIVLLDRVVVGGSGDKKGAVCVCAWNAK